MKMAGGMVVIMLSFWLSAVCAAESHVGVILDGYQNDCTVKNHGEEFDCRDNRKLFAGDEVVKLPSIKEVKIKWAPYADGKEISGTTLLVTFKPPRSKKGILQELREFIGYVETEHRVAMGATRKSTETWAPTPGNNATLMAGVKTRFVRAFEGGKYIVFLNDGGKEIFKKDGQLPIVLAPEEIGLSSGKIYTWKVGGVREGNSFKIKLLDHGMSNQILEDMKKVEEEDDIPAVKSLRKAAYLQLMSDVYPGELDLYWLSYQILDEIRDISMLKKEDRSLLKTLQAKYLRHFRADP
jgi:hypothetical protein